MVKIMYYLKLHELYKQTDKEERIKVRRSLRRNEAMAKKLISQHYACFYCGIAIGMDGHLDHLIPVYYGGTNKLGNFVASCAPCNLTKSTDQIEITNPYTIKDYLQLQRAFKRLDGKPWAYKDKRYRLYHKLRADLFVKV